MIVWITQRPNRVTRVKRSSWRRTLPVRERKVNDRLATKLKLKAMVVEMMLANSFGVLISQVSINNIPKSMAVLMVPMRR